MLETELSSSMELLRIIYNLGYYKNITKERTINNKQMLRALALLPLLVLCTNGIKFDYVS